MSRLLDALAAIDRRSPGFASSDGNAARCATIAPSGPHAHFSGSAADSWSNVETRLSAVDALSDQLELEQQLAVAAARGRASAPRPNAGLLPHGWRVPPIHARPAYRSLAVRMVEDLGTFAGPTAVLIVGSRAVTESGFCLLELAAVLAEDRPQVLAIDRQRAAPPNAMASVETPLAGMQEVLAEAASWADVIRPTGLDGVSFVGAGTAGAGRQIAAARSIWRRLPEAFRLALVQTTSADRAQSLELAHSCHAVYVLVELGIDGRNEIQSLLAGLRGVQADVRGLIAVERAAGE